MTYVTTSVAKRIYAHTSSVIRFIRSTETTGGKFMYHIYNGNKKIEYCQKEYIKSLELEESIFLGYE